MPDHTPDPIRDLENFGTGGVPVTPLEPAQVRRLGDRRRARRRATVLVAAAAVVAAAIIPVSLIAHSDGDTTQPFTHTPSPSPTKAVVPRTITYPDPGVFVQSDADTDKLTGTTPEFKTFIAAIASRAVKEGQSCPDAAAGVTVEKYSTAGYALGGYNACGGYQIVWGLKDGTWKQAFAGQDVPDCDSLRFFDIPVSFGGPCANEGGGFGPTEVSGLKLRMTPAEITAAGGTIAGTSAKHCRAVTLPYQVPEDGSSTLVSPTVGLAVFFAGPGQLTPEGIGLGSSIADVKKAYPHGHPTIDSTWVVPLAGSNEYQFLADQTGHVYEMDLITDHQDCVG